MAQSKSVRMVSMNRVLVASHVRIVTSRIAVGKLGDTTQLLAAPNASKPSEVTPSKLIRVAVSCRGVHDLRHAVR